MLRPSGIAVSGRSNITFGVVSDIHITRVGEGEKMAAWGNNLTFRHTLEWFRDQGVDAVLIAGDMADKAEWVVELSHRHGLKVPFVRFRTGARLHGWEGKAAWALRGGMDEDVAEAQKSQPSGSFVRGGRVADVTAMLKGNVLEWDAPPGRWTVLRIGHVNMCMRNAPAPKEATGWECDKLTPAGVEANFNAYIGRLAKGPLAGGLIRGFVVDSWECRCRTWSRTQEDDFRRMRGYGLRPMLPAVFGWVVYHSDNVPKYNTMVNIRS